MRKFTVLFVLVMAAALALVACEPQTVEVVKTVEVVTTQIVEIEGETVIITATPAPVEPEPEPEAEVALNPYLGSNKLDGNGIPATFFDDVHIRRAFAYCFDWDTLINDVYMCEAVQSKVLSLPGMPGYDPDAAFYTFDMDKCAEEFQLADVDKDGVPAGEDPDDVWEMGFRVQMLYNTGNTTRQIVGMLRDAGALEVHLRISAPPIRYSCNYGVDMSSREEMVAHERTEAEVAVEVGADSLAYLSMEGVYEAVGTPASVHCDACFTGEYPLGDLDTGQSKYAFENPLPVVPA